MKQTLVTARMGLDDLRGGLTVTRERLATESSELATMRRRRGQAVAINDAETVALAEKYEAHHAERVEVLQRKLSAQDAEFAIAERDVAQMTAELKAAMSGVGAELGDAGAAQRAAEAEAELATGDAGGVASEIDALSRASVRSARTADAERQLAELKRRMGK